MRFKRDGGGAGDGDARSSAQSRSLLFVDLAGSERVARTGAAGDARDEARAINGSLSALGRVIKTLGERRRRGRTSDAFSHVPYRDASLTMLLRDAFGGGSCTSVVIAVAGEREHAEETLCSLRFGERMAVVRNEPTRVVGNVSYAGDASVREEAPKRFLRLRSALASATEELEALALRGDAGGFVEGGPVTEIRSLRSGMERLSALDAESAGLRARLAEALRGGAAGGGRRGDGRERREEVGVSAERVGELREEGGGFALGGGAPEDHQGHMGRAHAVVRQESRGGESDTKRAGDGGVVSSLRSHRRFVQRRRIRIVRYLAREGGLLFYLRTRA